MNHSGHGVREWKSPQAWLVSTRSVSKWASTMSGLDCRYIWVGSLYKDFQIPAVWHVPRVKNYLEIHCSLGTSMRGLLVAVRLMMLLWFQGGWRMSCGMCQLLKPGYNWWSGFPFHLKFRAWTQRHHTLIESWSNSCWCYVRTLRMRSSCMFWSGPFSMPVSTLDLSMHLVCGWPAL